MNRSFALISRIFFITTLCGVCFSASLFMILESAEFFSRFYPKNAEHNFGVWAAILNEVFLVIMSAIWLPRSSQRKIGFHPGNLLIKTIMIFLFINTVGGASLNVVQEKLIDIQEQKNRIAVLKVLQTQIKDEYTNLDTFIQQNQRTNTVLTSRKLTEVKEELKQLQLTQQATFAIWIDIILITLVRFSIQLANITSVWLAGWLYRQPLSVSINHFSASSHATESPPKKEKEENKKNLYPESTYPNNQPTKNRIHATKTTKISSNNNTEHYRRYIKNILKRVRGKDQLLEVSRTLKIPYDCIERIINDKALYERDIFSLPSIKENLKEIYERENMH